jgi:hypothetical protein
MSYSIPHTVVGATRTGTEARAGFGQFLDEANSGGRGTVLADGGSWLWDTLKADRRWQNWDICALVPNVAGYVREATDYGMFGAGWRRLRRMNPLSWFRLGFQGMLNARGVLRRDFPTLLTLLLELEMANFRRFRPQVVFLHPQMTDLLLAMDHGKALEKALRKIRRGFGAEPGLATNNLGVLLPRLQSWGLEVPYVLTSVHPRGYGMRPGREKCEEVLKQFPGKVVATLDTPFAENVAAYWQKLGVTGAVYEAAEPEVKEWRSWQAWRQVKKAAEREPAKRVLVTAGTEDRP